MRRRSPLAPDLWPTPERPSPFSCRANPATFARQLMLRPSERTAPRPPPQARIALAPAKLPGDGGGSLCRAKIPLLDLEPKRHEGRCCRITPSVRSRLCLQRPCCFDRPCCFHPCAMLFFDCQFFLSHPP